VRPTRTAGPRRVFVDTSAYYARADPRDANHALATRLVAYIEEQRYRQLLRPAELADQWSPTRDSRINAWEIVHQLVRALEDPQAGSESAAAQLVTKLGGKAESARELAYRLFIMSDRKKRNLEARSYNALVQSWPEIMRLAAEQSSAQPQQADLFAEV